MKDRIRTVRKHFDLTQTKFGERIGIRGNTITNYETGLRIPSETVILAICREFNINREWLESGKGDMFIETRTNTLDKVTARYNGSKVFRAILDAYMALEPDEQEMFERYVNKMYEALASGAAPESVQPITARDELLDEKREIREARPNPAQGE